MMTDDKLSCPLNNFILLQHIHKHQTCIGRSARTCYNSTQQISHIYTGMLQTNLAAFRTRYDYLIKLIH